jgi:predicted RNase H-like nuclease
VIFIAGVDGCKGGWLVIRRDLRTSELSSEVFASGLQLFSQTSHHEVVSIDIPIGLTESGPRLCDVLARKMLRGARASSVFPAPIRPALGATDRRQADAISRSINGKGVSAQGFALYSRVREIDQIIRNDDRVRRVTYEVHPELCFMAWNRGVPIAEPKTSPEGMSARSALAKAHFGEEMVGMVRRAHPRSRVADDDIFDAFAALWTAERIRSGTAEVSPNPPDIDSVGLPMGMWF